MMKQQGYRWRALTVPVSIGGKANAGLMQSFSPSFQAMRTGLAWTSSFFFTAERVRTRHCDADKGRTSSKVEKEQTPRHPPSTACGSETAVST